MSCSLHESDALYEYHTKLSNQVRPTSTCHGSGPGYGVSCSMYTQELPRKAAADLDPVLMHRANLSSASPANAYNSASEDTLDQRITLTPQQQLAMNKGVGLYGYQTRVMDTETNLQELDMTGYHMRIPNQWPSGYQGYNQGITDTNTPSRMVSLAECNNKYRALKNVGPSAKSYGSYGTA